MQVKTKTQKIEKKILLLSFIAGVVFALAELIMAINTRSQAVLMDAAYDTIELVVIGLTIFLAPLFYKPITEKKPFGYAQVESIFVIVKGFMMLSVTVGLSVNSIEVALNGGHAVNGGQVATYEAILGIVSIGVFCVMKYWNRIASSPTVKLEIFGWKLDFAYSIGMAVAFFASTFLEKTPIAFILPYFDQLVVIVIILFMLPENMKMLWRAMQDVFLFSPETQTVEKIKELSGDILKTNNMEPVFYDITRTGRRLWIAIYFTVKEDVIIISELEDVYKKVNLVLGENFEDYICEIIPAVGDRGILKE